MAAKSSIPVDNIPFLDELFLNSPLCQICEYANMFGGVCSLLLNRRVPDLVIKHARIMSCSAHRNWVLELDESLVNLWNESSEDDPVTFDDFLNRNKKHNTDCG
jgi:hypothetical protein